MTNEITVPEKLSPARAEQELEFELTLPDLCPDIARLIRVDCRVTGAECAVTEGNAGCRGKAEFDVIYETDRRGRIKCCSVDREIELCAPIPARGRNASAFCRVECERITARVTSPRTAAIKAVIAAEVFAECLEPVTAVVPEEDGNAFFLKQTIGFDSPAVFEKTVKEFSESFVLSRGERAIGEIICARVTLAPAQITVGQGRAEIKTNAEATLLYEDESDEGAYYVTVKTAPVALTVESDALTEGANVKTELEATGIDAAPALDQYGESRVAEIKFTVTARTRISSPVAVTVAADMFERDYIDRTETVTVALPHATESAERSFNVEAEMPPEAPPFGAILDVTAAIRGASAERTAEGAVVSGTAIFTVTGMTEMGIYSRSSRVRFETPCPVELDGGETDMTAEVRPYDVSAALRPDGSVFAKAICGASTTVFRETRAEFISGVTERTPVESGGDECVMTFRFVEKGERLWDVAKEYRADPKRIAASNKKTFDDAGKTVIASGAIEI